MPIIEMGSVPPRYDGLHARDPFTLQCCSCDLGHSVGSDSVSLGRFNRSLQMHKLARGSGRKRAFEPQRKR
jgi:hypothetical protein